jgi:outer membrane protein, multidrug efflux system
MKASTPASIALVATLLAGCAVGPTYKASPLTPPKLIGVQADRETDAPMQVRWWEQFGDPVLNTLMQQASQANLDLRVAQAHLWEARSMVKDAESNLIPTIDPDASYTRYDGQIPGFSTSRIRYNAYQAGFDANWEIDIFGGLRRRVEASKADRGAEEASLRGVQVSLFAEVARSYFELRASQERLRILEATIQNQSDTLKLAQTRFDVGASGAQDVASAKARLREVEARLPTLESESRGDENRIAVLLGQRPGELDVDLSPQRVQSINTSLAMGPAGAALSRRPDVERAERQLAAETARIGVAQADFYPHLSLSGFLGFITSRTVDFGSGSSQAWSLTPGISWEGLNVERVRARLHAAEARKDAAEATYEEVILEAIEEVDDTISDYNASHLRVTKVVDQVAESRLASDLARKAYKTGTSSFLELLDAERVQLAAEDDLAQTEGSININAVRLYKALGGGWEACGDAACKLMAKKESPSHAGG